MSDEMVCIRIPESKEKMRAYFPEDPKGDFTIQYKFDIYKLQKPFLRLYSNYFKQKIGFDLPAIEIDEQFDSELVKNVFSCFYGASIEVQRRDIIQYFRVVKFFEVDSLQYTLRKDMIQNGTHYDIFQLFSLAYEYNEQKIFEVCLNLLEQKNYEQIKSNRKSLLESSPQLFKHVIKCFNKSQSQKYSIYEIGKLISDYCEFHTFGEEEVMAYKFALIDKHKLSSEQFKKIFLTNDYSKDKKKKKGDESIVLSPKSKDYSLKFNQEEFEEEIESDELDDFDQEGFKNSEKENLMKKIKEINDTYSNQLTKSESIKSQLYSLRKNLSQKETEERSVGKMFKSIEVRLDEMKKKWSDKSQKLNELVEKVNSYKELDNSGRNKEKEKENDRMIMSVVKDSFTLPNKKEKQKEEEIRVTKGKHTNTQIQSNIEYNQVKFDKKPVSIKTKQEMTNFINIICPDIFITKKLTLVYRRSSKSLKFGEKKDLRQKNSLVFIIRTKANKLVGGYIQRTIPLKAKGSLKDEDAFIFSVTSCRKFKVKASQKNEAISLDENYLICFGTDLMISQKCLEEESYCEWPQKYEKNKQIKERGSEWLVGETEFQIQELECYEVENSEMEMEI